MKEEAKPKKANFLITKLSARILWNKRKNNENWAGGCNVHL